MKQEIDVTKKYRTRDGQEVTGLRDTGTGTYPISGWLDGNMMWWTDTGEWQKYAGGNPLDLIPAADEPPKTWETMVGELYNEKRALADELGTPMNHDAMLAGVRKMKRTRDTDVDVIIDLTTDKDELNEHISRLVSQRDNWKDTAAQHLRNEQYYRNLLIQCGEAIGKEAYTADDGSVSEDVLVAKVPELVKGLVDKREETADLIYDIMRDEVNVIDECEKWLRAYAPEKLREAYAGKPATPVCPPELLPLPDRSVFMGKKSDIDETEAKPTHFFDRYTSKWDERVDAHIPLTTVDIYVTTAGDACHRAQPWFDESQVQSVANEPELTQPLGEAAVKKMGETVAQVIRAAAFPPSESEWPKKPAPPEPDHTEGGKYRMLGIEETLEQGDQHLRESGAWTETLNTGLAVGPGYAGRYRRPVKPETPDYAAEAKELIQSMFSHFQNERDTDLDKFVDLIIKAAKQP